MAVNIEVPQGADFQITFNLVDEAGADFDGTEYTALSQFRKHYHSNTGVSFTTAISNNHLTLSLTANQTLSLDEGKYVYDVLLVNSNTEISTRIIEGILLLTPGVTRNE